MLCLLISSCTKASNGDLAWRDTSRLSSSTIGASDRPFQQMLVARKLGIIGTQGNDTEDQRKLHVCFLLAIFGDIRVFSLDYDPLG